MSMLQALVGYYDRLAATGNAPAYGFSKELISFAVVLSRDGRAVDVQDVRDNTGRKPRPSRFEVPAPTTRSVNVSANFLWDKSAYSLGAHTAKDGKSVAFAGRGEHDAFKDLCLGLLAVTQDDGLCAFRKFLEGWTPQQFSALMHADDMLDQNIVFKLDGERGFIHDRPAAHQLWGDHLASLADENGMCLVSGRNAPLERLHPPIKGVTGAQSSGARIVSFNQQAFASYGKSRGDNAPVSRQAAFAYTTALNTLLARGSGRNVQIGDTTVVFWAEAMGDDATAEAAENFGAMLFGARTSEEEAARVKERLSIIVDGKPLEYVSPDIQEETRFFVLGLAPNASRLSVRFWHEDTIGALARRARDHWNDLRIDPPTWTSPPSAWRLLIETAAQRKSGNISPALAGPLMRAVLSGARYPSALLGAVIGRMRADKDINGMRVAICKACLARDFRLGFEREEVPMSLDVNDSTTAYLLGRLFAVYEAIQREALGRNVNATIKDRYFGAASATPASIFPLLERGSANHLASLRKGDKGGLAHWFEREVDSVFDRMGSAFPRSLRLEDQGRFAIGYHHQRARKRSSSKDADTPPADTNEG